MVDQAKIQDDEDNIVDKPESTEDKAKEIGKALDVEDDAPEYIIEEEQDNDEKIGKNREEDHKKERHELTNKEKRALRKKKLNDKFSEKDERIAAAESRAAAAEASAAALEARLNEVDGRLHGINKAEVEKAFNDAQVVFKKAEQDYLDGGAEGDSMKTLRALQAMATADDRMKQLRGVHQQLGKLPATTAIKEKQVKTDPVISSRADSWAAKNKWFKNDGSDVDSEMAKVVAGALVKEGFNPKDDDYWEELDDRLVDRGIGSAADDEEDEDFAQAPRQKKRAAPPVSGGSPRGDTNGKKTIKLPTSYINTLKMNGIWDDKPRLKKVLADRERILREQQ